MGRGRPITNMSHNLNSEAFIVLQEAARTAGYTFRGLDAGDYISEGWLRVVRKVPPDELIEGMDRLFLYLNCLKEMKRFWGTEWAKHRNEVHLSDHFEKISEGFEDSEPLTAMMAEEFLAMLPPVDRRLLRLRFWESMTWEQIGEAFGITSQGAQYRYDKIIATLQRKASVC